MIKIICNTEQDKLTKIICDTEQDKLNAYQMLLEDFTPCFWISNENYECLNNKTITCEQCINKYCKFEVKKNEIKENYK